MLGCEQCFFCLFLRGGLGCQFCVLVASWRHALRSEWPIITTGIIVIIVPVGPCLHMSYVTQHMHDTGSLGLMLQIYLRQDWANLALYRDV